MLKALPQRPAESFPWLAAEGSRRMGSTGEACGVEGEGACSGGGGRGSFGVYPAGAMLKALPDTQGSPFQAVQWRRSASLTSPPPCESAPTADPAASQLQWTSAQEPCWPAALATSGAGRSGHITGTCGGHPFRHDRGHGGALPDQRLPGWAQKDKHDPNSSAQDLGLGNESKHTSMPSVDAASVSLSDCRHTEASSSTDTVLGSIISTGSSTSTSARTSTNTSAWSSRHSSSCSFPPTPSLAAQSHLGTGPHSLTASSHLGATTAASTAASISESTRPAGHYQPSSPAPQPSPRTSRWNALTQAGHKHPVTADVSRREGATQVVRLAAFSRRSKSASEKEVSSWEVLFGEVLSRAGQEAAGAGGNSSAWLSRNADSLSGFCGVPASHVASAPPPPHPPRRQRGDASPSRLIVDVDRSPRDNNSLAYDPTTHVEIAFFSDSPGLKSSQNSHGRDLFRRSHSQQDRPSSEAFGSDWLLPSSGAAWRATQNGPPMSSGTDFHLEVGGSKEAAQEVLLLVVGVAAGRQLPGRALSRGAVSLGERALARPSIKYPHQAKRAEAATVPSGASGWESSSPNVQEWRQEEQQKRDKGEGGSRHPVLLIEKPSWINVAGVEGISIGDESSPVELNQAMGSTGLTASRASGKGSPGCHQPPLPISGRSISNDRFGKRPPKSPTTVGAALPRSTSETSRAAAHGARGQHQGGTTSRGPGGQHQGPPGSGPLVQGGAGTFPFPSGENSAWASGLVLQSSSGLNGSVSGGGEDACTVHQPESSLAFPVLCACGLVASECLVCDEPQGAIFPGSNAWSPPLTGVPAQGHGTPLCPCGVAASACLRCKSQTSGRPTGTLHSGGSNGESETSRHGFIRSATVSVSPSAAPQQQERIRWAGSTGPKTIKSTSVCEREATTGALRSGSAVGSTAVGNEFRRSSSGHNRRWTVDGVPFEQEPERQPAGAPKSVFGWAAQQRMRKDHV